MKNFLSILFLVFTISCYAQSNIPIGSWKSYLPLKNSKYFTYGNGKIYAAANEGLIVIEDEDFSASFFTKVDGLSNVDLKLLGYDGNNDQLIIVYEDSSFDLFSNEGVFPVKDIALNTSIQGSKKVNQVFIDAESTFSYFATDFGIVQYNLEKMEFGFTCISQQEIFQLTKFNNFLIAAAKNGAYYFDLNSNLNPSDFNSWELISTENGLPEEYRSYVVNEVDGNLYLSVDHMIYKSADGFNFELLTEFEAFYTPKDLVQLNEGWALTLKPEDGNGEIYFYDDNDALILEERACINRCNNVIQDGTGRIWISDDWDRIRYKNNVADECKYIDYNGPNSALVSDIQIKDNIVYVASGGVSDVFQYLFSRQGFYVLNDSKWTNTNEYNYPPFNENDILNVFKVLPHPNKPSLYVGSYWAGLIEYGLEDQSFTLWDKDNSSLQGTVGDELRTRISAMRFDNQQNLWVANFGAEKPLSVLTAEGNWFNFNIDADSRIADLIIDDSGLIWMFTAGTGGGVIVYDIGQNIQDPTDDRQKFINSSNSEIPTNQIKSIAKDIGGDVWVGTTEGVVVFECGLSVFEDNCIGNRPKVLQDSIVGYLLGAEVVQSILIDGANRKWFGTKNGLFLQSPNGEEQQVHFDESNSPLLDNEILDLAFNDDTGEVFIATARGIISYRSQATGATRTHSSEVYAFPNPVYPEYNGTIAIKGLAQDASVKITDLNGKLVHETAALGGQAIWDGNLFNGSRVAAGVYLVFSSTTNTFFDPDAYVTKILVMR